MKKILSLIILLIVLTSCLAKVDLEKDTGSLSINIGANTSQKSNISRAISSDTTKIYINLFQPSTHTEITREIAYTQGQSYNLTIDNLTEGVWDLHISTYNEMSAPLQTGTYFDMIEIYKDKDTVITHKFGAPKKIMPTNLSNGYGAWPALDTEFIGDGQTILDSTVKYIGFKNQGSTYHVSTLTVPEDTLSQVEFIIATDDEFKNIVPFYNSMITENSFITTSPTYYDSQVESENFAYAPVQISSSTYGYGYYLSPGTTYYWKAKLTNTIGTTESKVFSFTTGMP